MNCFEKGRVKGKRTKAKVIPLAGKFRSCHILRQAQYDIKMLNITGTCQSRLLNTEHWQT
jgi:hypothetical protein